MSKQVKLLAKFLKDPPPKNFKWDELVSMLRGFGYELRTNQGGSIRSFYNQNTGHTIRNVHKPHPGNEIKTYLVKEIRETLTQEGYM